MIYKPSPTIRDIYASQTIYDSVLDRLEIGEDDMIFRQQAQTNFESSLADFVATQVLKLSDRIQLAMLSDFQKRAYALTPFLSEEQILIEFLLIADNLREKIFITIPEFTDKFVDDFNLIRNANGK